MPVRSLLYFFTTHPSTDIQLSPCIAALICPFCRVYLFAISSVSNVHPYTSRYLALSFPFSFSVTLALLIRLPRTQLPPIFDIPVGFLRPAQSPFCEWVNIIIDPKLVVIPNWPWIGSRFVEYYPSDQNSDRDGSMPNGVMYVNLSLTAQVSHWLAALLLHSMVCLFLCGRVVACSP